MKIKKNSLYSILIFIVLLSLNLLIGIQMMNVEAAERTKENEEGFSNVVVENPSVIYSAHVQTYGWLKAVQDGDFMGTTGEAKRMEAIQVSLDNLDNYPGSDIKYSAHVQTYGWLQPVAEGNICGTSGQSKRMEAVKIELTGPIAEDYDIYYCVHVQSYGWLKWAKNGEIAGSTGLAKRIESICIKLLPKGSDAPSNMGNSNYAYLHEYWADYSAHMQTYGWGETVSNGMISGVTGQSKRMEALKLSLQNYDDFTDSGIQYRAHVQGIGWQNYVSNGEVAGTIGQSKRMEAIQIVLTGSISDYYDVYYCSHVQKLGWLGWAKNGDVSGSTGCSLRVEAIAVIILPKGANAPTNIGNGSIYVPNVESGWLSWNGSRYYLKSDGSFATESLEINGRLEVFRMDGRWIDTNNMDKKASTYSSNTNFLILVNTNDRVTKIYKKSSGKWVVAKNYLCTVGDNRKGWNTIKGDFYVGYSSWGNPYTRGYSFVDSENHTLYYWVRFCDSFLFHSQLYDLNTYHLSTKDNALGEALSHGCVRLRFENAKWIYNNIPDGTRVIVY